MRISTKENTVCRCSGTTFSSTFVVPLNTIDFANVWGKFDPANAAVYGTLIAFLVVYVITALYLRRQDKKDEEKVKTKYNMDLHLHEISKIDYYNISFSFFIVGDTFSK